MAQFYTSISHVGIHWGLVVGCTYPADDGGAAPALAHHVARAEACFARLGGVAGGVHVGAADAGDAVAEGFFCVDGDVLVGAAQGRGDEGGAVLDEAVVDHAAGAGEGVEGGEVDVGDDAKDDATDVRRCFLSLDWLFLWVGHVRIALKGSRDGVADGGRHR